VGKNQLGLWQHLLDPFGGGDGKTEADRTHQQDPGRPRGARWLQRTVERGTVRVEWRPALIGRSFPRARHASVQTSAHLHS